MRMVVQSVTTADGHTTVWHVWAGNRDQSHAILLLDVDPMASYWLAKHRNRSART